MRNYVRQTKKADIGRPLIIRSLGHQGIFDMEFAMIYTRNDAYLQFWYCLIKAI